MTKEECPKEYFEHLKGVVRAVFAADTELYNRGEFTKEKVSRMSAEEYCDKVTEVLISRTDKEEIKELL